MNEDKLKENTDGDPNTYCEKCEVDLCVDCKEDTKKCNECMQDGDEELRIVEKIGGVDVCVCKDGFEEVEGKCIEECLDNQWRDID